MDTDKMLIELDRLNKRCERYVGLYMSSSHKNETLIIKNKQLIQVNAELKKSNMIHKRVNDELVNDIRALENIINTKNESLNSKNDEIAELKKQIESLNKENSKLKSIIGKDVENSSIPSSINVYKKKVTNSREKSNKSKGGQKGHKGHSLEYLEATSVEVVNHDEICPKCGYISKPNIPHNLVNNVTYGKSLKSMVVLLNAYGLVSINRTAKMVNELTGGFIKIAESSICNIIKETSKKCECEIEVIKEKLLASPVLHVEETPIRSEGKLGYVHVLANN